ncbi:hypothetical protein JCM10207_009248 [Rhodosporidiobolus poonsookiae]
MQHTTDKHFHDEEKPWAEHVETASRASEQVGEEDALARRVKRPARELTQKEEDAMYRKVDWHLMPTVAILYLLSFMDRGNIGNARLYGLEAELGMSSADYNIALSCFFITYCFCEVPANIILKRTRPAYWIGGITVAWGIVMTCMGVVQNFGGLLATRLMLGVAEAGLFPGIVLILSLYYPRHKSQARVAFFFGAATLAGAFSGLLAYGIGFMDGVANYAAWRWIFILEGIATVVWGVVTVFILPPFPQDVKWLKPHEKEWLLYRKASDGSSVGEAEHVSKKYVMQAFTDIKTWLGIGYYFGVVTPLYAISLFAPTLINAFGTYSRPQVQLLTVPIYVAAFIFVMGTSIWADKRKSRYPFVMLDLILCLLGHVINITPAPNGVKYFGLFLIAMGAYGGLPSTVTWLTNNLSGQAKRGVGSAAQIGLGNLAALASSNVYRTQDKPEYYLGHGVVLGFVAIGFICAPLNAWYLSRENARKERELALPESERPKYTIQELRDLGDRAVEFRYTI